MPSSTSAATVSQKCSRGWSGPYMPGVMGIGVRATLCCNVKAAFLMVPRVPWCGAAQGEKPPQEISTA
eukprot:7749844-Pyramimonas_sp.AAC.1